MCVCVLSRFSRVQLFVTLWTAACQAPLSLGFLQARILEWVAMPSSRRTSKRECFSSSSIYIKRAHEQNGGGGQAESVWWVRALFPQKDIERVISAYPGGFLVPGLLVCRDQVQMFGGFPSKGSKQTRWALHPGESFWRAAALYDMCPKSTSSREGNGTPLQCSCLENDRDRGAWWAAVYGISQSSTRLKQLSSSSSNCSLKKKRFCSLKINFLSY